MHDQQNENLVFVYGTLRQGGRYHHLLEQATFLGAAKTSPRYVLVDVGSYPAMLKNGTQAIHGEVYRVHEHTLKELDILEGVPELYTREQIHLSDGTVAWVYFMPPHLGQDLPVIESGDYFSRVTKIPTR